MTADNYVGPWRALDEQEVAELRRRRRDDREYWSIKRLAKAYGIAERTVYRYLSGRPTPVERHVARVVDRWATQFGHDLRQQERDALVAMLTTRLGSDKRGDRHALAPSVAA